MESKQAIARLGALAHAARLQVFRLLVRAGPGGLAAGEIAQSLRIPPQTLSFHLKDLATAGLIESRRQGRSLVYSLRTQAMRELLAYLSADCCQGRLELCAPAGGSERARRGTRANSTSRRSVLFLCTRNSARSQIAEALLRKHAGDRFEVHSAGLQPSSVHPLTHRVLGELGIDTSSHHAKDFGSVLGRIPIQVAIVVCDRAHAECRRIQPFARQRLYWPFADPAADAGSKAAQLAKFRAVRDAIDARVREWVAQLPEQTTAGR